MKKTSLGSFQWKVEVMSRECLIDWPEELRQLEILSKKNQEKIFVLMKSMDMSILVLQILVLE